MKNFRILAGSGKDFVTRIPLIPEVTDTEENISQIAKFLYENGVGYAELLPYNKIAGGKYKMLQREYLPLFSENKEIMIHYDIFSRFGIEIKIM